MTVQDEIARSNVQQEAKEILEKIQKKLNLPEYRKAELEEN